MRAKSTFRPTFAAVIAISCVAATGAAATPSVDLGLGGIKVPPIELPTVTPPSIDQSTIKPPSVDLQPTVDSAGKVVQQLTGGGSGGGGTGGGNPGPPSTPPTSPGASPPPTSSAPPSGESSPKGAANKTKTSTSSSGKSSTEPGTTAPKGPRATPAAGAISASKRGDAKSGAGGGRAEKSPPAGQDTLIRVVEAFSWTLFGVLLAITLLVLGMTGRSATLARVARRLKQQRGELNDDVGAMQRALLPPVPPRIGETNFSVAYRSAGPASGGDFHDVVELEGGLIGILVGDACGHGRDAVHTTALVHYTVRAYLEAGLEPREAIRLADEKVGGKLGGDFVTVLCGIYDPRHSSLSYATAGHPAPLVVGGPGDQSISLLTDPPIGVGSPSGTRQTQISVPDGCQLCFFSDGLSEARTDRDELIGRHGLAVKLDEIGAQAEAGEMLGRLDEVITTDDDITLLTLRPELARGTTRVTEDLELDAHVAGLGELRYFLTAAGLDANEAQRAQTQAVRHASERIAHLRVHHGGEGRTNWEFVRQAGASGTARKPAPHLELVMHAASAGPTEPVF